MTSLRPLIPVVLVSSALVAGACATTPDRTDRADTRTTAEAAAAPVTARDQIGFLRPIGSCGEVAWVLSDLLGDLVEIDADVSVEEYRCAWGPEGTVGTDPARTGARVEGTATNPGFTPDAVRAAHTSTLLSSPATEAARAVAYSRDTATTRTVVVETPDARVEVVLTGALSESSADAVLADLMTLIEQP
ncbi:hypothetical protein G4H71_12505 [Rhodococcus triatomae]|uniref:DUF3558 domain-containing protein n=1 Tax=Rhodococcus triatomae TaxID=300028 RepID=A0A1G8GLT2_9NOCA|nr:hypothetical protein [Rhodococcus triatomae]QNG20347.1 hypothetical protein G4H72_17875 [Rhodococcus triatomae]QNG23737.1 hypothetical protein G4H71_12505 [Rhodococcus triatomae]SDH95260.1 hypothetical protein SAMN05444695_104141 [Rhodococcus triatomae]